MPAVCSENPPDFDFHGEPDSAYEGAVRLLPLLSQIDDSTGGIMASLWQADSSALEWELAMVVGMEEISNEYQARAAAAFYLRMSGRGQPMLGVVRYYSVGNRWGQALTALKRPLSDDEERAVLVVACQAYWLLESVERDTTNERLVERGTGVTQLIRAEGLVRGSAELLTGARLQEVQRWIAELGL
jgi:hypothetical protein